MQWHTVTYPQVICEEGDTINQLRLVVSGEVKAQTQSSDARPSVTCVLQPGHYFGEVPIMMPDTQANATYSAGPTGCCLLVLPGSEFVKLFGSDPNFQVWRVTPTAVTAVTAVRVNTDPNFWGGELVRLHDE